MQVTTYQEARAYLESFIQPGEKARSIRYSDQSLERLRTILVHLDNPHTKFQSIQVSGTAGKGSTSYFLAKILTISGYKTGLTISPHLESLTERIQINMLPIPEREYIQLLNLVIPAIEKIQKESLGRVTYMEILMVMVFTYFAQEKIDIAVIEVGLEGRYDSTNVLSPLMAILTNIHLDHIEVLGSSVEAIAREAVSIITSENQITIVGNVQKSVLGIVKHRVNETNGILRVYGKDFSTSFVSSNSEESYFSYNSERILSNLRIVMKGAYQVDNAALAIDAAVQLNSRGFSVPDSSIRIALQDALFPGRFEIVQYQNRTIILDGAHNPIKMASFLAALKQYYPNHKKIIILGFKQGKMVTEMLDDILPTADELILTQFHTTLETHKNAAMHIDQLQAMIGKVKKNTGHLSLSKDTNIALQQAIEKSTQDSVIVITGSLYLVGEVRKLIQSTASFS